MTLRFDILTIFPDFFGAVFDYGIVRRARAASLVEINSHDLRAWTTDKHHITDDRPFGGGDGMVMKPEPIFAAVEDLITKFAEATSKPRVVMLSPQGRVLTQSVARELALESHIVLICGRYEGIDERIVETLVTDEISIGDFVLSGGEAAAIVLIDAVTRLVPGALGSETSAANDSFSDGVLDFPHYTRPPEFRGQNVPQVLLEGNHAEIARWRRRAALLKTRRNRPDLINKANLSAEEKAWLVSESENDDSDA